MTLSTISVHPKAMLLPEEMFEISRDISKKYSPVVSAKSSGFAKRVVLTPKDLLAISQEITQKYTRKHFSKSPDLVVLPIDPENLYVSWSLGSSQTNQEVKNDAQGFVLRIYPKPDENALATRTDHWFDIELDQTQNRQKVPVPKELSAKAYSAAIGTLDQEDDGLTIIAASKDVHIPRSSMESCQSSETGILPNSSRSQIVVIPPGKVAGHE